MVYPIRSLIYTKCKKNPSNLIKVISSYKIYSGIKSQKAKKKKHLSITVPKTFDFSKFLCSISSSYFKPLKNKPNESCKNSKKGNECLIHHKKSF